MCLLGTEMSTLEKSPFRSAVYFILVFLILSSINCLYILEIKPLLVTAFTNLFSHSIGCLFVLLMVSTSVQKFIKLIWFHLQVFFFFISFSLGDWSKKILLQFMSEHVLLLVCFLISCINFWLCPVFVATKAFL